VHGSAIIGGPTKPSGLHRLQERPLMWICSGISGRKRSSKKLNSYWKSRILLLKKFSPCGRGPPVGYTAGYPQMNRQPLQEWLRLPRNTLSLHTFNRGTSFHTSVDLNDRRHRRASKEASSTIKKWAADQWSNLGMLSMTFYSYVNKEGTLVAAW
jgi:hypothetical protein